MRGRARGSCLAAVVAAALAMDPRSAVAQRDRYRFEADSAFPAADTVRVEMREVPEMRGCFVSNFVVHDAASLAELRRYPQFKEVVVPPIGGRMLAGVRVFTDCHALNDIRAYRSQRLREIRIVLISRYGGCRAMRSEMQWFELPPLPDGWTVRFLARRLAERDLFTGMGMRSDPLRSDRGVYDAAAAARH